VSSARYELSFHTLFKLTLCFTMFNGLISEGESSSCSLGLSELFRRFKVKGCSLNKLSKRKGREERKRRQGEEEVRRKSRLKHKDNKNRRK
jgi:hypothetical protein